MRTFLNFCRSIIIFKSDPLDRSMKGTCGHMAPASESVNSELISHYQPAPYVIFDCDPGVDDALALSLILAAQSRSTLLGVTTVCGNTSVENGTNNALALLESAGFSTVHVAKGCHTFTDHDFDGGVPHIHGATGSGEITLTTHHKPSDKDAAQFIIDTVREHPHRVDIIAVGPLSNLAEVLKRDPEIPSLVRHLHIMGGAFWRPGNVSPDGEANIHNDVTAADAVFSAEWSGFIAPLDATLDTYFEPSNLNQLASSSSQHAQLLAKIADFYCHFYESCTGKFGCSLHDPLAVGVALNLFAPTSVRTGKVTVDTSEATYGRTRLWDVSGKEIHTNTSTTQPLRAKEAPEKVSLESRGTWMVLSEPQEVFPKLLVDYLCTLP